MTETSPAAMLCPRNNCKPGGVGVMLPNLEGKVKPSEIVTSVVSDQLTSLLLLILINIFSSWDDTN